MGWVPFLGIFEHLVSLTINTIYPKAKCRRDQAQRRKIPPQGGIFKHLVSPTYSLIYPKAKCRLRMSEIEMSVKTHKE